MSIKVNFKFLVSIKLVFSSDLRYFDTLNKTNVKHYEGRLEIFNGELIAIAGQETRNVEILKNGQWENMMPVGNKTGYLYRFSSLAISGNPSDTLFVFGIHFLTIYF